MTVPCTNAQDGYTVTLLPPSNITISTVAVSEDSGQCLDDTNLSTADGTQYQRYSCEGGYQQMLDLKPVAGRANTCTVVNGLSGKWERPFGHQPLPCSRQVWFFLVPRVLPESQVHW